MLATLMSAAAAMLGVATHRYWAPCRGQMLNGSVLSGYQYTGEFSEACLIRMDSGGPLVPGWRMGGDPGIEYLETAGVLTLAVAWVAFVAVQRWSGSARLAAAVPGILTGLVGVAGLPQTDSLTVGEGWLSWLMVGVDLTALVAAAVVVQHSHGRARVGQLVALWAVASFGRMRWVSDYLLSITASDANWDVPPGHGYFTALTIALCAVGAAALGLTRRRPRHRDDPLPAMVRPRAG